jgi:predicted dehydrogenase
VQPNTYQINRRAFLQRSAAVAAATGLPLWYAERIQAQAAEETKPLSPNDRPGIALIGCGGQGTGDAHGARRFGEVVAVCDVDDAQAEKAVKAFTKDKKVPAKFNDFRKVMEQKEVQIVITGTPDHWHTLVNLAATKAGKDIYTEKPLTLTIDEGKRLVKAVKEKGNVLQVGSQQRSDGKFRLACELVRNGRLGKLQHIIVGLPTGPREGPFRAQPIPAGLNWDQYLGQAPAMDFNGHNLHWNFRWWYCFSGGQMTDWGAHHNDIAQWAMGTERSGPVEIKGQSLAEMIPGGYDAASKYRVECKYANGVTMEIVDERTISPRHVVGEGRKTPNGIQFIGSDGWIFVTRGKLEASRPELLSDPLPEKAERLYKSDDHMGNFFSCVRSRQRPICDVEIGHRSISVAHLGVIAVRSGLALRWDPAQEVFVGENARQANLWLSREMRKPYDYSLIA